MKHFIYRLEITDGEHQYYSSGLCRAMNEKNAIKKAGAAAKTWYEADKPEDIRQSGGYPIYQFSGWVNDVICGVDQVEEITKEHYNILSEYIAYL
jgi:hypothetical protein